MKNEDLYSSVVNPYSTTLGKTLPFEPIERKLQDLVTSFNSMDKRDLDYGYNIGKNLIPVIITGRDEREENVPFFTFPVVFHGPRDEKFIGIDVREYVNRNNLKANYIELRDSKKLELVINKFDNVNMLLLMAGLMDRLSVMGGFESINKDLVIESYSFLYSYIIKSMVNLTFIESVDVKYNTVLYYYSILKNERVDEMKIDRLIGYMNKYNKVFSLNAKDHDILTSGFIQEQINISDDMYTKLSSLLKLSSYSLSKDKQNIFQPQVFLGTGLKNIWLGVGKQHASMMMFENLPVFISMLYFATKSSTYKDSRLSKILKGSNVNFKLLHKHLEDEFNFLK